MKKSLREEFSLFFESPSREALRRLLKSHFGEMDDLDFKMQWPEEPEIVRHLLALANSGGGCIIIGITQKPDTTFEISGVDKIVDKAKLRDGVQKYISKKLQYDILDFAYSDSEYPALVGKKFQVLLVEDTPQYIPFLVESDGRDLQRGTIYIRRNTNSIKASYDELQNMLNRRITTNYSSQNELLLEQHLKELKALYREAAGTPYQHSEILEIGGIPDEYLSWEDEYDHFIHQLIGKKRRIIEALIMKGQTIQKDDIQNYDDFYP